MDKVAKSRAWDEVYSASNRENSIQEIVGRAVVCSECIGDDSMLWSADDSGLLEVEELDSRRSLPLEKKAASSQGYEGDSLWAGVLSWWS